MIKCLVLMALTCCMQSGEAAGENDRAVQLPLFATQYENVKSSVIMNGHNNYQAAQQIFYIYGLDQLKNSASKSQIMMNCCKNLSKLRDDYIVTPGIGAHKLHTVPHNWNAAREFCVLEGAHLAIINSDAEEKVLLKMLAQNKLNGSWVGIHDLFNEGDWTTVLDQSLESTGFAKWTTKWENQPDNFRGNQNCGLLVDQGGLDDGFCSWTLPFICKITLTTCTEDIPKAN